MEILAAIYGSLSIAWLVFGIGLLLLGQQLGTWKRLTKAEEPWKQKIAGMGFSYVMPAGILITAALTSLILLLGIVTFVVMLFLL